MTPKLTISAKELNNKINYIPFTDTQDNFLLQTQRKEVIQEGNNIKYVMTYGSTLGAMLIPGVAFAAEPINTAQEELISPQVIFQYGLTIGLIGLGVSFAVAITMFIYTGILKMLKQRNVSKEWTTDIIKGFVHCLAAIPTIFALYYIATTLFSQLRFLDM